MKTSPYILAAALLATATRGQAQDIKKPAVVNAVPVGRVANIDSIAEHEARQIAIPSPRALDEVKEKDESPKSNPKYLAKRQKDLETIYRAFLGQPRKEINFDQKEYQTLIRESNFRSMRNDCCSNSKRFLFDAMLYYFPDFFPDSAQIVGFHQNINRFRTIIRDPATPVTVRQEILNTLNFWLEDPQSKEVESSINSFNNTRAALNQELGSKNLETIRKTKIKPELIQELMRLSQLKEALSSNPRDQVTYKLARYWIGRARGFDIETAYYYTKALCLILEKLDQNNSKNDAYIELLNSNCLDAHDNKGLVEVLQLLFPNQQSKEPGRLTLPADLRKAAG